MSDVPAAGDPAPDNLSRGDALAMVGAWSAAISAWADAVRERPELRGAVERRLRWFLGETGHATSGGHRLAPLVLAFAVATVLGTAFLAFSGSPGSTSADLWAVAAWVMVAVAAVAAVVAARQSGHSSMPRLLARACKIAAEIDPHPPMGESR